LAESADQEAARAQQYPDRAEWPAQPGNGDGFVRWVSPQQLRRSPGGDTVVTQPTPAVHAERPSSPSGFSAWLPWTTTNR